MDRYKRLLICILTIDVIFVIGVFWLCCAADGAEQRDKAETLSSLSMESESAAHISKSDIFDESIYERSVIPSGMAMGIYMKTDGVLVVDICSFRNERGESICPAEGVLETGDYIVSVNGEAVSKRSEVLGAVADSGGDALNIGYVRDGIEKMCMILPQKNENGTYLMGAWIKDDVSGIGTVTFVDGLNFMALGHSVSDIDTGITMSCSTGGVYTTDITSISRSYSSEPGRLQGNISYGRALVGIIDGNSESGIYGHLQSSYIKSAYSDAEELYIARGYEAECGKAYIYSRMMGELKKYEIQVEQVEYDADEKNIEFLVTDDELLALTGGVVQGMSGSPIIQNNRIIGAVTHVFVDDPARGYGIFIEGMLK